MGKLVDYFHFQKTNGLEFKNPIQGKYYLTFHKNIEGEYRYCH